jgi:hypothetical protein
LEITLKLYGNFKRYAPNRNENAKLKVETGTTIRAVLSRASVPDAAVWMCTINDSVVDDIATLRAGDVLEV